MSTSILHRPLRPAKTLAAGAFALALAAVSLPAQTPTPTASPKSAGEGKEGRLSTAEETYLQQTASENLGEIAIAYLALEKAASNDTKTNAKDIIDTHTKSMKELMALVSKHDFFVKLEPDLSSYHKLVDQSGNTFDKFYAAEQRHFPCSQASVETLSPATLRHALRCWTRSPCSQTFPVNELRDALGNRQAPPAGTRSASTILVEQNAGAQTRALG